MAAEYDEIRIRAADVRSLHWQGDHLVDWVAGERRFFLDGTIENSRVIWSYRFDSVVVSRSGRFVAPYEKLGTKALLLEDGKLLRELNRSFYHADAYEYPIAFLTLPDGSEAIAHCPQDYCRLDFENAATGECLTDHSDRKPTDFFHSRLNVSPHGRWLASAGWVWHPIDLVTTFCVSSALENPNLLDQGTGCPFDADVQSVSFLEDDRLLASLGNEGPGSSFTKTALAILDIGQRTIVRATTLPSPAGSIIPFGNGMVLCLYEHPRLRRISDGNVVLEWPHLPTGKQTSSIIHHLDPIPPIAKHPNKPMFAVADNKNITVVRIAKEVLL